MLVFLLFTISTVTTCTSHSITLEVENSGNINCMVHFSLVETGPAAVFQTAVASRFKRNFLTHSFLICVCVDPESSSILFPVVFGFPSVVWVRPNVIGARCISFWRLQDFRFGL